MIEPGEADGQVFPRALELWRPLLRPGGCLVASGFVPAHRLSTVRHAQRIFVLEAGRVAESGTHEEPVTSSGPGPRR